MKKLNLIILLIVLSLLLSPVFFQKTAGAFDFEPNDIISNSELQDYDALDLSGIQEFLNSQNGILKNYRTKDYFGIEKSVAEIIYVAAQNYKINPQWILATLQKEQSLITNPSPSQYNLDWAMGYAVCDSCSVDDPQVVRFKGLGTQIDRATWRIRYYYENPQEFNFQVGQLKLVDGKDVLPYNQATANLYNYTPHLHGNYNFWNIWNRWFSKMYPDGTLVREEGQPGVWLIQDGQRRPFWSQAALVSRFDVTRIIEISKNDLNRYPVGNPIRHANYSLLKNSEGEIYLIVNNEKKHIADSEVFRTIGYNYDEVISVPDEELAYYQYGKEVTLTSLYPQGALLQDNKTGGVYYVEDGIKHPIIDREILAVNYKNFKLTQVSPEELDKYLTAAGKVKFNDGTLIKSADDSKVYVISNGQRRWIANETTFNKLNYDFKDVHIVSQRVADLHIEGQSLDLNFSAENKIAID